MSMKLTGYLPTSGDTMTHAKKQETMICFVSELFIVAAHNLEPFKVEVEKMNTTPAAVSVTTKDLGSWVDNHGTRHSEIKEIIVRFETVLIKDDDILERWDRSDCDCQWTKYIDLSDAAQMTANFMFEIESLVAAMAIDYGDCLDFGYEEV